MKLVDTHNHINLYYFLEPLLDYAQENHVEKIIGVGMSEASQERVLEISRKYAEIYPALGIHPQEVEENPEIEQYLPQIIDFIESMIPELVAIGEIGLDHHFVKNSALYPLQEEIFRQMLGIAEKHALPVTLHVKGAEQEVFDCLASFTIPHVVLHWYTGPESLIHEGLTRGYFFSVTPAIRYSPPMKRTVELCPTDRLLLESDGPVEYSGVPGQPGDIYGVLKRIAKLKAVVVEDLANRIYDNTKVVFPKLFA